MRRRIIEQNQEHLEMLEAWIERAEKYFKENYELVLSKDDKECTNQDLVKINGGVELECYIDMIKKRLKRMRDGQIMPQNVLRDIEALENAPIH